MKFLEYTPLARLNGFLNHVNLGECVLKGSLEAYSCKLAGIDRKLSRSLEQEVLDCLDHSPEDFSSSPMGPLYSTSSRRTLIYLILTMNHMYPDYDFSVVQVQNFYKEYSLNSLKAKLENHLLEAGKVWAAEYGEDNLFESLWNAIEEVIELLDCEVYSYVPQVEDDPFMERGSIWSFNLFFYNKKLKRILSFSCHCLSKLATDDLSGDELLSDEDVMLDSMDME